MTPDAAFDPASLDPADGARARELDPLILQSKVNFFLQLDRQRRELQAKLKEAQAYRAAYEAEKQRGQKN